METEPINKITNEQKQKQSPDFFFSIYKQKWEKILASAFDFSTH